MSREKRMVLVLMHYYVPNSSNSERVIISGSTGKNKNCLSPEKKNSVVCQLSVFSHKLKSTLCVWSVPGAAGDSTPPAETAGTAPQLSSHPGGGQAGSRRHRIFFPNQTSILALKE